MNHQFCIDVHCFSMADLVCFVKKILKECSCSDDVVSDIHLILEELVTNIIRHGDASRIDLCFQVSDDRFMVEISDSGMSFDPLSYKVQGLDDEFAEREIGGMGIYLVKEMADELLYRYENGRNILQCIKIISRKN
jgi:serine/threonine-protein kinase RsbW